MGSEFNGRVEHRLLDAINSPADLKKLTPTQLDQLGSEIRDFIVQKVSLTGGHLGSNLGAVELTLALHRTFDSPKDVLLWDTGHQAYVHKLVTGRRKQFDSLRQEDGLSGYPSRKESEHDYIENSHASTVLSYAHGLATAAKVQGRDQRVVAVIGDGSMTGGMAFEGLNNLGHSKSRVLIVLNDNGRSYAPTVSWMSDSLSRLRANPRYMNVRNQIERRIKDLPGGGLAAAGIKGMKAAVREAVEPFAFFEALGVRYIGPIDGHDIAGMEQAFRDAREYDGPIVVHVLTTKGRGYAPAEDDDEKNLHDVKVFDPSTGPAPAKGGDYTEVFSRALLNVGANDSAVFAITAAMPGPTGLLPFEAKYPDRFLDVGIAEQHAVTMATGMAMGGLKPVVALYSTFFSRAFDQAMYDTALHRQNVTFALDRAGLTGDDGASHNGVYDMSLCLKIPGMTMFIPSSAQELAVMLEAAVNVDGPAVIRYPKGAARQVADDQVGTGMQARKVRDGSHGAIVAVGKTLEAAEVAAAQLAKEGINLTVWDPRVVKPFDEQMIADVAGHNFIVTVEDGVRIGGVGSALAAALSEVTTAKITHLGTPDAFLDQAKPDVLAAANCLDADGIAHAIRTALIDHASA